MAKARAVAKLTLCCDVYTPTIQTSSPAWSNRGWLFLKEQSFLPRKGKKNDENDFKGGQPGSLDPFSSSVNGVPGYPDRFWIQFSMAKKNSSRLFTCRACSLSGAFRLIFAFDFLYFHSLPPSRQKYFSTDRYRLID